jgi:hypothetical protein
MKTRVRCYVLNVALPTSHEGRVLGLRQRVEEQDVVLDLLLPNSVHNLLPERRVDGVAVHFVHLEYLDYQEQEGIAKVSTCVSKSSSACGDGVNRGERERATGSISHGPEQCCWDMRRKTSVSGGARAQCRKGRDALLTALSTMLSLHTPSAANMAALCLPTESVASS